MRRQVRHQVLEDRLLDRLAFRRAFVPGRRGPRSARARVVGSGHGGGLFPSVILSLDTCVEVPADRGIARSSASWLI